jgi:hypothetical protein
MMTPRFVALVISCVAASTTAFAGGPLQENLIHQETRKCSEQEFVVFGEFSDLHVFPGQSNWVEIEGNEVPVFCGSFEERLFCPPETAFVWVTRTGPFEVLLGCYKN